MPNPQQQPAFWGSTQISIGLSAIVKLGIDSFQCQSELRWLSGGSLEVAPLVAGIAGGTLSGTSCVLWGKGYLLGTTEVFQNTASAVTYVMASNATCVINMLIGYTQGSTLLP